MAGQGARPNERPDLFVSFLIPPLSTGPISQDQFERMERLIKLQTADTGN